MKYLIFLISLQVFAFDLCAQNDYLLLTKGKTHQRIKKIPEGSRVTIIPAVSENGNLRGKFEIVNDSCIAVGGDSIFLNNIEKILVRFPSTNLLGGLSTLVGLAMAIGGSNALSSMALNDNPLLAILQIIEASLLVGVIGAGVVFTVAGVLLLTRGIAYKTTGKNGFSVSIYHVNNYIPVNSIAESQHQKYGFHFQF